MGLPATQIAEHMDIHRDHKIELFVLMAEENEPQLANEKLGPFLSMFVVKTDRMLDLAEEMLMRNGAGHTASVFTNAPQNIDQFAKRMPAGRLLVNTPATFGMMGVSTELPISFMLGSGSWGKNLSTDAVIWRDFVNIKRLARHAYKVNTNIEYNYSQAITRR